MAFNFWLFLAAEDHKDNFSLSLQYDYLVKLYKQSETTLCFQLEKEIIKKNNIIHKNINTE